MYNEFFGLQKSPFCLTPDPEFLYWTEKHREATAGLTYAIMARKGIVVLTGDAGTGKTSLLTRMLRNLPDSRVHSSVIINPTLTTAEFLEAAMMDFGIDDIPASKALRIAMLQDFLFALHGEGKIAALIVDEAHKLTPELLEEIRLLGNFESASEKLLQIILIGQTELDVLLGSESLRQFKQRIALRLTIDPLAPEEIEKYIWCRWVKAGGSRFPFTADAISTIGQVSRGVPRVVNVLCDNALMGAFGEHSATVERSHVLSACRDLGLGAPQLPGVAPVVLAAPPVALPVVEEFSMRTLARYDTSAAKRSLWARLVGKLKSTQRTEPA